MTEDLLYSSKAVWVLFFALLYWAFCLFWGVRSARQARSAADFFVAGRSLPIWVFVMGATASSFAGWIFIGQPALVLRDGLQAGYLAFAAIVVPISGILFLKRQWMLGKRFGYVTPGELLSAYYGSDVPRLFTVVVALLFGVPLLALLLGLSGQAVSLVTDGLLSRDTAMWALSVALLIYVTLGGLRAVAYVSTLQTILLAAGMVLLGLAALDLVGGFGALNEALARVAAQASGQWGTTRGFGGGDYNALFATPGVAQWSAGLGEEDPVGGLWTGLMVMTLLLSFLGVQASPAFSLWAFASTSPRAFAPQQVWACGCAIGLLLFIFATLQGLGGQLLGANGAIAGSGLAVANLLPPLDGREGELPARLVNLVGQTSPWLAGVLTVCLLAAIKAGAGAYMAAAGTVVTRDLYMRYFDPGAGAERQKGFARVMILILTVLALLMATFVREGTLVLGALALSLSAQLFPALLGVTWVPWLTRRGVAAGLFAGALVVLLTDQVGYTLTDGNLPWGPWPWTIHAAVWGLAANFLVAILASAASRNPEERRHRAAFHAFLAEHSRPAGGRRQRMVTFAWSVMLVWLFFAIGPGIVLGNHLFGPPAAGYEGWDFAMPSIWAWQLLWWGLGVLLIWFLAYKMDFSTPPAREVVALREDSATGPRAAGASSPRGGPAMRAGQEAV